MFRKLLRFTAFLAFPAMLGLAMVTREFILLTIGEKWTESIPLLQILCIGAAFAPFYILFQHLTISKERSDLYMWCNIGQMAIQLALVLLLYPKGITAVVIAHAAFSILWLGVWQAIVHRLLGVRLLEVLKDVVPFLVVSLVVMAVTYVATRAITSLPLLLAARVVMAGVLYAAIMKLLQAKVMDECIAFIKKHKVS